MQAFGTTLVVPSLREFETGRDKLVPTIIRPVAFNESGIDFQLAAYPSRANAIIGWKRMDNRMKDAHALLDGNG